MIKHLLQFGLILAFIAILLILTQSKESPAQKQVNWQKTLSTNNKTDKLEINLVVNKPRKIAAGTILLPASGNERVLLIDSNANTLQEWKVDAERARLMPDGNLLVVMGSKWGEKKFPWENYKNFIVKMNQASEVVWDYEAQDLLHHDFNVLANGNLLLLRKEVVDQDLRKTTYQDHKRWNGIRSDQIFEIDQNKQIIWTWSASDHLDINSCGRRPCIFHKKDKVQRKNLRPQEWTHLNTVSVIPNNKWYQAGHQEFKPGNIMTLPRNFWEAIIIEKETGEIVWRYGDDASGGLIFGHEVHMIEPHLPGAGNVLIFDNGGKHRPYSIIKELNPVTRDIIWSFSDPQNFFSPSGGAVQRLENGNTFISGDNGGNIFEVTSAGEIVWQIKTNLRINRARKYSHPKKSVRLKRTSWDGYHAVALAKAGFKANEIVGFTILSTPIGTCEKGKSLC